MDASAITIDGGSLSGYAVASIALMHTVAALNAIVQKAALWWPARQYWLFESWQEHLGAPDEIERAIFHEYGRYDIHFSRQNPEIANVLSKANGVVSTSREYDGGHNYRSWRHGLIQGRQWILNSRHQS